MTRNMILHVHKQPFPAGVTFIVMLAVTLHQSFTTEAPPTVPAPGSTTPPATPSIPERGNYNVSNSNGTTCLLASMALQLNITFMSSLQSKPVQELVNLRPDDTKISGSCESESASLVLTEDNTTLTFFFSLNSTSSKYRLSGMELAATWPDMEPFSVSNSTLDYLHASLGRSYMCRNEQTIAVATNFSLNTFQLQVQAFAVNGNTFGAAEECEQDEDEMLIPIVVGGALAALVLIVLIAYFIGRRRSHAGYQTI